MKGKWMLYIDQYGHKIGAKSIKELRDGAAKMLGISGWPFKVYRDKTNSPPVHIGYGIGRHWFTAYQPVELPA